jgi:putative ABC transport system ATP-binding protein
LSPICSVDGLTRRRGTARDGFEVVLPWLELAAGDVVGVVGASGCGKSTLLHLLCFSLAPDTVNRFVFAPPGEGAVDVAALWRVARAGDRLDRLRARGIGHIAQTHNLVPSLTVRENIDLPRRLTGRSDPAWGRHLVDQLDIAALLDRKPAALSVGQRQRVAVARALAHRPAIVFADEPTAALNGELADVVLDLLVRHAVDGGAALVVATHDVARLSRWTEKRLAAGVSTTAGGPRSEFRPDGPWT